MPQTLRNISLKSKSEITIGLNKLYSWKLIPMKSTLKFIPNFVPRCFIVTNFVRCSNKEHYRQLPFNGCIVLLITLMATPGDTIQ